MRMVISINPENILPSTKCYGIYEKPLITILEKFFTEKGYLAIPHVSFNIAWGSILSDVDLLLLKEGKITLIEVKSRRDVVSRAYNQIKRAYDYVDYAYLATESYPKSWNYKDIGLIIICGNKVKIIKNATFIKKNLKHTSIDALKKKCLTRFHQVTSDSNTAKHTREKLVSYASNRIKKQELKAIVTCGINCEDNCPIWRFET